MSDLSWARTVRLVHERAAFRCEYCQTSQHITAQAMQVDHIDPNGEDHLDNLCLACGNCNLSKSQATTGTDPETGQIVQLFDPRQQKWTEHFEWMPEGTVLRGLTPCGRATIQRLRINRERAVRARSLWVESGLHPPP